MEIVIGDVDVQAIATAVVQMLKPQLVKGQEVKDDDVVMGVPELAEYLGMSEKWVYDQTGSRRIPYFKLGSILKFRKTVIDRWLRSFDVPAVDQPSALSKLKSRR